MNRPLTTGIAAFLLTALAACSGDDDGTAADPEPTPTAPAAREFEPTDYTYVLETQCFCPMEGPVLITVQDRKVVSAVYRRTGEPALEHYRVTINDLIAEANNPEHDEVDVTWPEGQDWPSKIAIDRIERAIDDEVAYVVRRVRVTG